MQIELHTESDTYQLASQVAQHCPRQQFTIHLIGELGAGKTTFTRGFLRALGHSGHVKSPTYTLVEQYQLHNMTICHFDLYRLADPEELDYIGLDDYLNTQTICLIEWPEQGGNRLPQPDLTLNLAYQASGRTALLTAHSQSAKLMLQTL